MRKMNSELNDQISKKTGSTRKSSARGGGMRRQSSMFLPPLSVLSLHEGDADNEGVKEQEPFPSPKDTSNNDTASAPITKPQENLNSCIDSPIEHDAEYNVPPSLTAKI